MTTQLSTRQTLTAGPYRAVVDPVGATVLALTVDGHDLVVPYDEAPFPASYAGKTLVPWVNRIAGGTYTVDGERFEVPINEHATGCALHGLTAFTAWDVANSADSALTLRLQLPPSYGYPFPLELTATFALNAGTGLSVSISATNRGDRTAPYGAGIHPYLTCGGARVDDCVLESPGHTVVTTDDHLLPTGEEPVAGTDLDYREPRPIGEATIDNAFRAPDGEWTCSLTDPATGISARVTSAAPWLQLYSGDLIGRAGMAIEPMTSPPDAFNSGVDLVRLAPGATHELALRIWGELNSPTD